jgi:hypothetical protein
LTNDHINKKPIPARVISVPDGLTFLPLSATAAKYYFVIGTFLKEANGPEIHRICTNLCLKLHSLRRNLIFQNQVNNERKQEAPL